jgi:hypothetical protein
MPHPREQPCPFLTHCRSSNAYGTSAPLQAVRLHCLPHQHLPHSSPSRIPTTIPAMPIGERIAHIAPDADFLHLDMDMPVGHTDSFASLRESELVKLFAYTLAFHPTLENCHPLHLPFLFLLIPSSSEDSSASPGPRKQVAAQTNLARAVSSPRHCLTLSSPFPIVVSPWRSSKRCCSSACGNCRRRHLAKFHLSHSFTAASPVASPRFDNTDHGTNGIKNLLTSSFHSSGSSGSGAPCSIKNGRSPDRHGNATANTAYDVRVHRYDLAQAVHHVANTALPPPLQHSITQSRTSCHQCRRHQPTTTHPSPRPRNTLTFHSYSDAHATTADKLQGLEFSLTEDGQDLKYPGDVRDTHVLGSERPSEVGWKTGRTSIAQDHSLFPWNWSIQNLCVVYIAPN